MKILHMVAMSFLFLMIALLNLYFSFIINNAKQSRSPNQDVDLNYDKNSSE